MQSGDDTDWVVCSRRNADAPCVCPKIGHLLAAFRHPGHRMQHLLCIQKIYICSNIMFINNKYVANYYGLSGMSFALELAESVLWVGLLPGLAHAETWLGC